MFAELLKNPIVLALPPVLSVVFAFLLSRLVELVPAFAVWWDAQADEFKIAYRGWAGLVLATALVLFGYFSGYLEFATDSLEAWLILIAAVVISWLLFVGGAEGTYRITAPSLPRKQVGWHDAPAPPRAPCC